MKASECRGTVFFRYLTMNPVRVARSHNDPVAIDHPEVDELLVLSLVFDQER